jgi:hypothetical protein
MYFVISIYFLVAAVYHATAQISAAQTLYSEKSFNSLRTCAIGCFEMYYGTWGCCNDILSPELGCPLPYPNSCFCRTDLQPVASSIISKCVSSACQNTIDVDSAVGVYIGYCATATQTIPTALTISTASTSSTGNAISTLDFASSSMTLAIAGQSSAFTVGTSTPSTAYSSVFTVWTSTPSTAHSFFNELGLGITRHILLISS